MAHQLVERSGSVSHSNLHKIYEIAMDNDSNFKHEYPFLCFFFPKPAIIRFQYQVCFDHHRRPFLSYSASWSRSRRRGAEERRKKKRSQAIKPSRPLASRIPPRTRETPPPNREETGPSESRDRGAMVVRRLSGAGRALLTLPNIRRRASNSWAAVRDTFFSTKVLTKT